MLDEVIRNRIDFIYDEEIVSLPPGRGRAPKTPRRDASRPREGDRVPGLDAGSAKRGRHYPTPLRRGGGASVHAPPHILSPPRPPRPLKVSTPQCPVHLVLLVTLRAPTSGDGVHSGIVSSGICTLPPSPTVRNLRGAKSGLPFFAGSKGSSHRKGVELMSEEP